MSLTPKDSGLGTLEDRAPLMWAGLILAAGLPPFEE
jgi:hypothetical protein